MKAGKATEMTSITIDNIEEAVSLPFTNDNYI